MSESYADTFCVSLSIQQAAEMVDQAVIDRSVTGERIDSYSMSGPGDLLCVVIVYEKHYYRAGNRLTLTVTLDNMSGKTRIHTIGGGGGQGLFRFDWGAGKGFSGTSQTVFSPDMTSEAGSQLRPTNLPSSPISLGNLPPAPPESTPSY